MSTETESHEFIGWYEGYHGRDAEVAGLRAEIERKDAEITWLKSSLVSLLVLAEAKPSPLTNEQVASICRTTLGKFSAPEQRGDDGNRR